MVDPTPAAHLPASNSPPPGTLSAGEPPPPAALAPSRWYALPGLAILTACLLAGDEMKAHFGLILPANILGLFILLALLALGVVPERWVQGAARLLLWLLPLLFVPVFVLALRDRGFWTSRGPTLLAIMFLATLLLWAAAGHLSQWLLAKKE